MIRKSLPCVITVLLLAFSAGAAEEKDRICALTRVYECTTGGECGELTIEEMALPRFVRIDLKNSSIISLDKNVKRDDTKITRIQELEGITVLQGIEQRGWSIAIGEESGNLTLSASGDGHGFLVFGVCMNP